MILWLELKKLLLAPILIGFIILCVAINIIIVLTGANSYYEEIESEPYNVFEEYDAKALADYYIRLHGMTGKAEANIHEKYEGLQIVIDNKAENGDALYRYFGNETYEKHGLLFGTLLFAIIAEGCLIALFAALMSTGFENTHNTEQLIYSSRHGRRILRSKLAASLLTGFSALIVLICVSLAVFFARFDYSAVWNDNVSSSFNFAPGEWLKPFITWHSFTVAELLWAVIGTAMGLTVVFSLFGVTIGMVFRNGYAACGIAITMCIIQFMTPFLFQMGGTLRGILNLTPVMLVMSSGKWFTDGGADIICANFECVGIASLATILAAACVLAAIQFKRREFL